MLSSTTSRLLLNLNQAQFSATQVMDELMAYDKKTKRLAEDLEDANSMVAKLAKDKDAGDKEVASLQSRVNDLCDRNNTLETNLKLQVEVNRKMHYQVQCQADRLDDTYNNTYHH